MTKTFALDSNQAAFAETSDPVAATMYPQSLLELPETKDLSAKVASELTQDADGDDSFNLDDPVRHVGWLRDAEALLLSHLIQDTKS